MIIFALIGPLETAQQAVITTLIYFLLVVVVVKVKNVTKHELIQTWSKICIYLGYISGLSVRVLTEIFNC